MALPVRFRLADDWRPVDPERAGAPAAAMVAIGPSTSDGFAASITLTESEGSLSELADLALGRLVRVSRSVSLLRRSTPDAAITQAVRLITSIRGVEREVVQCHAFVPVSEGRAMEAVLTTTPAQFGQVIGEFGEFVGSIEADI
jgi:hypothetical protein